MKLSILFAFYFICNLSVHAQDTLWTRHINTLPDSVPLQPVRIQHDGNDHLLTLSTYYNYTNTVTENKIHLRKFDADGKALWTLLYDDKNTGRSRGYDMALDEKGYTYICGIVNLKPLLLKVNTAGTIVWQLDTFKAFKTGSFGQIIYQKGRLYLSGYGVACVDTAGNEIWSKNLNASCMAVDARGQAILSAIDTGNIYLSRFALNGQRNFSDSFYDAKRIVTDAYHSFYVLSDLPGYVLSKYDSTGKKQWSKSSFPAHTSFGDNGMQLLIDQNNDLIVLGILDSMYKYNASGKLLWYKSMQGLDFYSIAAAITGENQVLIAGTTINGNSYDMKVAQFNLQGNMNWHQVYSGNSNKQEYAVDLAIDHTGIYAIETNDKKGTLVKFEFPSFEQTPDYNLFCVDSVWYDLTNAGNIFVRIFNGSTSFISYPGVIIVTPDGDTISKHITMFFGQMSNSYQTYRSPINKVGITDFKPYKFLLTTGIGMIDTMVHIHWCETLGVQPRSSLATTVKIYPNPFRDGFSIKVPENSNTDQFVLHVYDAMGRLVIETALVDTGQNIQREQISGGIYFYVIYSYGHIVQTGKLVAE